MTSDKISPTAVQVDIRQISAEQLGVLGVSQVAYIKPIVVNGARAFAIHGADGTPMALAGEEAQAFAAIMEQELIPIRVH